MKHDSACSMSDQYADDVRQRQAGRDLRLILCNIFADGVEVFGSPIGQYIHDAEFYNKVNVAAGVIERLWAELNDGDGGAIMNQDQSAESDRGVCPTCGLTMSMFHPDHAAEGVARPGKVQCSNYCWSEFKTAFPSE